MKNCCNSFKTHKTTIKRKLRVISVEFAKDLQKNQLAIYSRKKSFWKSRLNKLCEVALSSYSDTDFTRLNRPTDGEENTCTGQISNCKLNTSLIKFLQGFIRDRHKS